MKNSQVMPSEIRLQISGRDSSLPAGQSQQRYLGREQRSEHVGRAERRESRIDSRRLRQRRPAPTPPPETSSLHAKLWLWAVQSEAPAYWQRCRGKRRSPLLLLSSGSARGGDWNRCIQSPLHVLAHEVERRRIGMR